MKNVIIKREHRYEDGCYVALISVCGFEFAIISEPKGNVHIYPTGAKHGNYTGPSWALVSTAKIAQRFGKQQCA